MAFQDFSFQGVPYHPPVAPVVPEPSDTAARTIAAGTQTGVMGFVHMAIAAKQAQLEQEQMLQRADLAAQELQYRDKWQQQDYEVAKQNADTMAGYRTDMANNAMAQTNALNAVRNSTAALNDEKRKQLQAGMVTAAQATLQFGNQMLALNNDFENRVTELGARDPKKQTQDPVALADAVTTLRGEYPNPPSGSGIQTELNRLQGIVDKQKTTIELNGEKKSLSYQQILSGLRNPDTRQDYYDALIDAGHITTQEDTGHTRPFVMGHLFDAAWDKITGTTEKKTVKKPSGISAKILTQEMLVDPSAIHSRIPTDTARSALDLRARVMPTPGNINDAATGRVNSSPGLTPEPEPTETDSMIARAKAAISAGKDPTAVRAYLESKGVDPSALDE